jgi:hypothetical protein
LGQPSILEGYCEKILELKNHSVSVGDAFYSQNTTDFI